MSHPLLFYGMAKREFGPLIVAVAILYYFFTSQQLIDFSFLDIGIRILISAMYNLLRNPDRLDGKSMLWVIPGIFFYYIPLPAVHLWSMLTLTADGWGTTMRASQERARKDTVRKAWFETGFFVAWMGIIAGSAAKWLSTHYHIDWAHRAVAVSLSVCIASFGAWKVTIQGQ